MTTTPAGPARSGLRGAALFVILACLAACSPANAVDVKYDGYTLQPSRTSMKAGDIVFDINNQNGQVQHQFLVVQSDLPAGQLTVGADGKVDAASLKIVGQVTAVELGQSSTLTAQLAPGHYILMCNIVGHYQLGMHADFTVTR
jgi:uncharacterized cupredoxin-like copper-binding protein